MELDKTTERKMAYEEAINKINQAEENLDFAMENWMTCPSETNAEEYSQAQRNLKNLRNEIWK